MTRPLAALLLTALAMTAALAAAPALAQPAIRPQQQQAAPQGPPPALPGLAARRPVAPIPAEGGVALAPNAALFDAIGRGDLAAAREAVGRGADLNARNALGLTPVDAAVDQGRNDIAFYLLSARDATRTLPPPPEAPARVSTPLAAPRQAAPRGRETSLRTAEAAQAVPSTARLWAGDGGAPRPEVGFLGFDAGRPAGAAPPRPGVR
ncbi:MAG TPA: ankyrin repeat domain-containing protein [Acetobacteraceae bacterium]|jgi:hypothetical protein|nr:ankyrin repeat domain-containing protein [Acetobacteraceae bacterium]